MILDDQAAGDILGKPLVDLFRKRGYVIEQGFAGGFPGIIVRDPNPQRQVGRYVQLIVPSDNPIHETRPDH